MSASLHFLLLMVAGVVTGSSSAKPTTLILLDIDNTLYSERSAGIEAQIVRNTHFYCRERYGMDKGAADDLFKKYGSTIEGLKKTRWPNAGNQDMQKELDDFYRGVYNDIDYSSLLPESSLLTEASTGYSHAKDRELLSQLLGCSPYPLCIASNSPSWHVAKTLEAMGLGNVKFKYRFTPDRLALYPTKNDPEEFFAGVCDELNTYDRLVLFDDSKHNLQRVCDYFPKAEGVHVSEEKRLADVILKNGLVDPNFSFDQVGYLEAKNIVDRESIDSTLWNNVVDELLWLRKGVIQIVDVGAGIFSMLDLFLHGDPKAGLNGLIDKLGPSVMLDYIAFESNRALFGASHEKLLSWGFSVKEQVSDDQFIYETENVRVRFVLSDFDSIGTKHSPDLIVGCCFADLMDPAQLVTSLIRSFHLLETKSTMLYFPITFGGVTQFLPPRPAETNEESNIPSDTVAFRLYSKALVETLGHNLNPTLLADAMERHGLYLEHTVASNWKIDPNTNPYLYETMLYFFGTAGAPRILEEGWDAYGWIRRARQNRPKIQVSNVDLLFRKGKRQSSPTHDYNEGSRFLHEIQFTAPKEVTTTTKEIPELGPTEVLGTCT